MTVARVAALVLVNLLIAGFTGTKTYYLLGLIAGLLAFDGAGLSTEAALSAYPLSFVFGTYIVHFYDAVLR